MKPYTLPRRHFLRGVGGALVALPILPSLQPAYANTKAPRRLMIMFQPCGIDVKTFWPKTPPGALSDASLEATGLAPLQGMTAKLLVMRGMHGAPKGHGRDIKINDHGLGTNTRLTAAGVSNGLADAISVDQAIARQINPERRPALVSAVARGGQRDSLFISFNGSRQPAPVANNPFKVYQDFMGLAGADPALIERITKRRQSVLDLVRGQFERLQASSRLGKQDKDKLDLHFTGIRDVETKVAESCKLEAEVEASLKAVNPTLLGAASTFEDYSKLHMDVLTLAIACGHTNVATLMFGAGAHTSTFSWLGHKHDHHLISHRVVSFTSGAALVGAEAMLHAIDLWHAKRFRYLADRLDSYADVDGTILDNSALLWVNELSDGKSHHYRDLPFVMAGSAGGYFKQGQFVNLSKLADPLSLHIKMLEENAPANKLLTMLCNAMGMKADNGGPVTMFGRYGLEGEYPELRA